jgi:ATP-dependent DNA helicase RecQ
LPTRTDRVPAPATAAPTATPTPFATPSEVQILPAKLQLRYVAWLRISVDHGRAAAILGQVERESGTKADLLDEWAALALARRDLPELRAAWSRRLDTFPAPSARVRYAQALLEMGEVAEAFALTEELQAEHGELKTVQALVAEVALQTGDLATAHDVWSALLTADSANIAATLAAARIALLGGDGDEARAALDRALGQPESLTPAQLATAAGLCDLLGQPVRSPALRLRYAREEAARAGALAAEIDAALGRDPDASASNETAGTDLPDAIPEVPAEHEATRAEAEAAGFTDAAAIDLEETPNDQRVLPTLREIFGHEALLPGQAAVINRALAGNDTLAILPTGAGKSLTFQLPSLLLPGVTLVISPLIALMKDQYEGLPAPLRQRAVLVNSTLSPDQQRRALGQIASGETKLVYAAPERLRQPAFLRALRQADVSLVVVDEAHCISLWGHDFRPDYLSIPASLPELGNPPLLAMTATASPETAASLSGAFRRKLDVVRTSSFRPNLSYAAERLGSKEEKARRVVELCRELPGSGIVYVSSRRDADNLAGVLNDRGVRAVPYHAGLEPRLRAMNQDHFMSGQARVVVATVAFGMGVDKPDVRFIIHASPSTSLEAYAQESGRAGRDGADSRCILLYTSADRASQTRLANRDAMDLDTLRQVYSGITRHAVGPWAIFNPSRIVLNARPGDDPDELPDPRIGIGLLEQGKLLSRHPNAPVNWTLVRRHGSEPDSASRGEANDDLWRRFAEWARLDGESRDHVIVQTAAACAALEFTPEALARVLDEAPGWDAREGDRLTCLQILPAGENAGARLQRVIAEAAARSRARVDRMMTYAAGRRCRHVELAAHLGERLQPCGDACDVCTRGAGSAPEDGGQPGKSSPAAARKRAKTTATDPLAVLNAVATAPFPFGKTGLVRLLEGSIQSRIQADRSPAFGALADLQKSKIDALIDRLVDDGFLDRDLDHEYKLIRLTARGRSAGPDDFAEYSQGGDLPPISGTEDLDLGPGETALLARLQEWRRERAAQDAVPAYVVAHNAVLVEIARHRPATLPDLAEIKGYGPAKVDKYGQEILEVLHAARTSETSV